MVLVLRAKSKLRFRRKVRWNGLKVPKLVNVSSLKDTKVKEKIQGIFERTNFDGTWNQFNTSVCQASGELFLVMLRVSIRIVLAKMFPKFASFWKPGAESTGSSWMHLRKTEQYYCSHLKMLSYHCSTISA